MTRPCGLPRPPEITRSESARTLVREGLIFALEACAIAYGLE